MISAIRYLIVFALIGGIVLTGLLGTSTTMTFVWPGYLMLGVAGFLSIGVLFKQVSFSLSAWLVGLVMVCLFYLIARASDSPVSYFAREDILLVTVCLVTYAGVISLCNSVEWRRRLAYAFAFVLLVNLGFAALQGTINPTAWLLPGYGRSVTDAIGGLYNQPDHFAVFVAALVPLWLALGIQGRQEGARRLFWRSLVAMSLLFLAFAGSIAGWLALLCGLVVYGVLSAYLVWDRLKMKVRRMICYMGAMGGIALIAFIASGGGYIAQNLGHGMFAEPGKAGLAHLWKVGVKQAMESPVIGTGSRSSQIYGRFFREENWGPDAIEPEFVHNEYLQMMGDYGIVGLALLMLLLGAHLLRGLKFLRSFRTIKPFKGMLIAHSDHLAMSLGGLGVLAALGLAAGFDFIFHLPVFALLAATILAILAVPDPMAQIVSKEEVEPIIPGGSSVFGLRAVSFGGGVAILALGAIFARSEHHYEVARRGFESGAPNGSYAYDLKRAIELDPQNPFIQTLSAHVQVSKIDPLMPLSERREILDRADHHFSMAEKIYPQDVFAAIGHVAVLDELGKKEQARERLRAAREWAPLYGNLMQAEAEHYLRNGEIGLAREAYTDSLSAGAFRDEAAAKEGLRTVSEWKLIAQQNGIPVDQLDRNRPSDGMRRVLPDAQVVEREVAGQAEGEDAGEQ